jgi:hypothetical protein
MNYFFIVAFLLFYNNITYGSIGKYPIQNFTPIDYKAGIQNIDFAQNRDMTLFVANNLGVLSYNGNEWKRHDFKTGKKKRSLAFDADNNRLYVGSQGEFGYFHTNWEYVSLLNKIPNEEKGFDEVWDVFIQNSKVYFCTFQGIYIYDGKDISVIKNDNGFNRSFKADGKIFTQSSFGKLYEIKENKLVETYKQKQNNQIISGLISHQAGLLLFYNSGDIEYSTVLDVNPIYINLIKDIKGTFINHVLQLSGTKISISTQTAGLFLYDFQNNETENITKTDGLESNACLRSFQDFAGNLWVGMQNGIALIHINSPIRLINQSVKLQGSGYEVFEKAEGIYFTTSNGIYYMPNGQNKSTFIKGSEGPAYGIQLIADKLYAGHHTGLFLLENGQARKVASLDGVWGLKQLRAHPEHAIAGTYTGLYLFKINKDKTLVPVQKISGFNESSRFFEEDQFGRIIVGQYYKGLYQLTLNETLQSVQVNRYESHGTLPIDDQIILSSIDNEIYIGTDFGLYRIDATEEKINKADQFSEVIQNQAVYSLKQDKQKHIHVITDERAGFFRHISSNNFVFEPSSLFQYRYYLNNDLLNVSDNIRNGIIYSANEGFILYHPELEYRVDVERPLLISRIYSVTEDSTLYIQNPFEVKNENIEKLIVSPKAKVLQISVESFQFNDAKNFQYRFFLKDFDNDYGPWTNATSKEYTNLTEGNYELHIQTRNYLGEIINSNPYSIQVNPPFFRSLTAKIIYFLLAIGGIIAISGMQKRKYKKQSEKLEELKQIELAKKQKRLIEIEKQKEQELLQLREEKMQGELIQLNNLLASSTMNLVVKNEFIENIKQELKDLKKKGANQETKKALEKIEREIDSTLRIQEDWDQFEYHFDQVHGDFLHRFREEFEDLSPNDQKLSAFLRLNLNTKEIANLMGISIRGIEVARYRLRKKLGLDTGDNLSKFILEY